MSRAGAAESGFTLLELLVVLAVIGLIAGLAAPRFSALAQPSLRQVATDIALELRATRLQALRSGRVVELAPAALAARLPASVSLAAAPAAPLVFYPDGRSSGGRWQVADGSSTATLEIDWLTGAVRQSR
jgi:general secretion pathway protein H